MYPHPWGLGELGGTSEKKAFAAEWVEVQQSVATFIAAAGPQFHDAEDLLQKVAVIAYEKYDDFDPERATFLAWVIGIARNELMHWHRSAGRDRHVFAPEVVDTLAEVQSKISQQPSFFSQALAFCLEQIRGRSRDVLELRYTDELTPTEIAERLDTSSSSVRVTLTRARKSIRECVERRLNSNES